MLSLSVPVVRSSVGAEEKLQRSLHGVYAAEIECNHVVYVVTGHVDLDIQCFRKQRIRRQKRPDVAGVSIQSES